MGAGAVAAIVSSIVVVAITAGLLVFFLVIKPDEKKMRTDQKAVAASAAAAQSAEADAKAAQQAAAAMKAADIKRAAAAAAAKKADKGKFENLVDDIILMGKVDSLLDGPLRVAGSGSGLQERFVPTTGSKKQLFDGRFTDDGSSEATPEWISDMDSSEAMVRGPDGKLRPTPDSTRARIGATEQFKSMVDARATRVAPTVVESWDDASIFGTNTSLSRDAEERINRRIAIAAAMERDTYPNGLDPLVGPKDPYFESLKARLG